MKFNKSSQLFPVSRVFLIAMAGLLAATLMTSCEITTIDFVFVASSAGSGSGSAGQIQTFDVDSESGAIRNGQPTVPSGGTSPAAMAVSSNYQHLYVINQGNNSVVHFAIGASAVLTKQDSTTAINTPVALAVDTPGTYLYVLTGPDPAVLTAYSLSSSGAIGSVVSQQTLSLSGVSSKYAKDVLVPTGVTVLANNNTVSGNGVFVTAYDQNAYNPGGPVTSTANPGWVFGYSIGSGGVLTPAANSPFQAGVKPSAIVSDPTDRFVYVTDYASNELIGYSIHDGSTLAFLINGPFKTNNEPQAVVIDPRGKYIYVANALSSSVASYSIDLATGTPASNIGASNSTDTEPVAIVVDAALGRFVYTANYLGNSISGFKLDPNTGELTATQASPYPSGAQPAAVASIPAGSHAIETITP
ncbi:MAG: beta-propeller fold lactonase family protein [Terracidiphilus sp.]|jgi:6-phosphogluconolactonase (cycloisomerase 2 family)